MNYCPKDRECFGRAKNKNEQTKRTETQFNSDSATEIHTRACVIIMTREKKLETANYWRFFLSMLANSRKND